MSWHFVYHKIFPNKFDLYQPASAILPQQGENGGTYAERVKRLEKFGFKETTASITMKLRRGAIAAMAYRSDPEIY